jgi:hypothetical protein
VFGTAQALDLLHRAMNRSQLPLKLRDQVELVGDEISASRSKAASSSRSIAAMIRSGAAVFKHVASDRSAFQLSFQLSPFRSATLPLSLLRFIPRKAARITP